MKKSIWIFVLFLTMLSSCRLNPVNNDGFSLFGLSLMVEDDLVMVQSHNGYMVEKEGIEKIYKEKIFKLPVEIQNITNQTIDVKITYSGENSYWQEIDANSSLLLEE